jgi:hypothetical protein
VQLEVVKDYYGKMLKSSKDLKSSACCDGAELPPHLQPLLANVHPEVLPNITAAASRAGRAWRPACARSRLELGPRHHPRGREIEARIGKILLGHRSPVQARWTRKRLCSHLQGEHGRAARCLRARRPPPHRARRSVPVCGNTWRMLADTRFRQHFDFVGDFSTHYGIFPSCGASIPFAASEATKASSVGCC